MKLINLVVVLLLLSLVASVAGGFIFYYNQKRQEVNIEQVKMSNDILYEATLLLSSIKDIETGQEGFIITNDAEYLHPYEQGMIDIETHYKILQRLLKQSKGYDAKLSELRMWIDKKRWIAAQTVTLAKSNKIKEAVEIIKTGRGKAYMDRMRVLFQEINAEELGKQSVRNEWLDEILQAIGITMLFVFAIVIGITFLAMLSLLKLNKQNRTLIKTLDVQNEQLEVKIRERTLALEENNKELRAIEEELVQQNEEINVTNMQLTTSNQRLEELSKLQSNILGIVAHDLRNPVNAILGLSNLVKLSIKDFENQKDIKEYITLIDASCNKATDIIKDLLEITELESTYQLVRQPTHLHTLIENCLKMQEMGLEKKRIKIVKSYDPQVADILLDAPKFARVIDNLLSNAIKFSLEASEIEVFTEKKDGKIILKIKDNGVGMNAQMREVLFDKFSEARRAGTQGESSTGLGMSIVKQIVELHHGKISVESIEGQGSVFIIELEIR